VVVVSVAYPGASPSEVEHAVVLPVEAAVADVDGVDAVESTARAGGGEVRITVASGPEVHSRFHAIKRAVDGIESFPADVERPIVSHPSRTAHFVVATEPSTLSGADNIIGAPRRELTVAVEPERLRAYGLTVDDVTRALQVGTLPGERPLVRIRDPIDGLDTLVLKTTETGSMLRLGDIATLRLADVGAIVLRGDQNVMLGWMRMPPEPGPSVLEVVSPDGCGEPPVVTLTAEPTRPLNRPMLEALARRLSRASPEVVVVAEREAIRLMAPAGEDADAHASNMLRALRNEPMLAVTDIDGVGSAQVLDLSHAELDAIRRAVDAVVEAARSDEGAEAIARVRPMAEELDIKLDRDAATALGLTDVDIARQVRARHYGVEATRLGDGRSQLAVRVISTGDDDNELASVDDLRSMTIHAPNGTDVPLSSVATLRLGTAPSEIERRGERRSMSVVVWGPGAKTATARLTEVARATVPGIAASTRE
jgi:multidrug efflux pump subunit AcrB